MLEKGCPNERLLLQILGLCRHVHDCISLRTAKIEFSKMEILFSFLPRTAKIDFSKMEILYFSFPRTVKFDFSKMEIIFKMKKSIKSRAFHDAAQRVRNVFRTVLQYGRIQHGQRSLRRYLS